MNGRLLLDILAVTVAGALVPLQTAFNAQLARALNSAALSAVVLFAVGLATMTIIAAAMRTPLPNAGQMAAAPPLSWIAGGLAACAYIVVLMVIAPRIGASAVVAFVVVGQVVCSALIDHYGWLGFEEHPLNWPRVLGMVLLVAGAALVRLN